MSFADLRVVMVAFILFVTYSTFLFMNASESGVVNEVGVNSFAGFGNTTKYNDPDAGGFFGTLTTIGEMNTNTPELFFINSILFGAIAFILVFVGLRFLRGTG